MNIGIIVLAAGSSSRMGRSKQLLEIDGEPCFAHALTRLWRQAHGQVVVVWEQMKRRIATSSKISS